MLTLRRRTADAHRALEERLDLLAPDLGADGYADVLVMMASIYGPLEPAIEAAIGSAPQGLDLSGRRKVPMLRADLGALGRPWPAACDIPPIVGTAGALGALYVTEGATLGGTLISAHLDAALPRSFFTAYGSDVPLRWTEFRDAARATLADPADLDHAADTADAVFLTFVRAAEAL